MNETEEVPCLGDFHSSRGRPGDCAEGRGGRASEQGCVIGEGAKWASGEGVPGAENSRAEAPRLLADRWPHTKQTCLGCTMHPQMHLGHVSTVGAQGSRQVSD